MQKLLVSVTLSLLLSACSSFPGVYKIDVQQGNVVTQGMLNQLRPGMTKDQVKYVLGTPLVEDTFSPDRWDYIYTMQKGGGKVTEQRIAIFFKDDKLVRLTGDLRPH